MIDSRNSEHQIALKIKEAGLRIVAAHGEPFRFHLACGRAVSIPVANLDGLTVMLTTPFQRILDECADIPEFTRDARAYSLSVWQMSGAKLYELLWWVDGSVELIDFVRGNWEQKILGADA